MAKENLTDKKRNKLQACLLFFTGFQGIFHYKLLVDFIVLVEFSDVNAVEPPISLGWVLKKGTRSFSKQIRRNQRQPLV